MVGAVLNFCLRAEADDALRGVMYRLIFWRSPKSDSIHRQDREDHGFYYHLTTVGGTIFLALIGIAAIGRGLVRLF